MITSAIMFRSEVAAPYKLYIMNTIILKGYFKDAECDAIFKYARFLPESDEPYIFKRSSKMYNVILLNGKDYTNAPIVLGES